MNETEHTQKLRAAVEAADRYRKFAADQMEWLMVDAVVCLNDFERRGGSADEFPLLAEYRRLKEESVKLHTEALQ